MHPSDNSHVQQNELDTVWTATLFATKVCSLFLTIFAKYFFVLGFQGKFLFFKVKSANFSCDGETSRVLLDNFSPILS